MLEIVAGEKGTGKTRVLINKANDAVKVANGSVLYMDWNNKHMYELSNRVRLINLPSYHIITPDMFLGFLYGVISQNREISLLFIDNFMRTSTADESNLVTLFKQVLKISEDYEMDITMSIAKDREKLPPELKEYVTVSLPVQE